MTILSPQPCLKSGIVNLSVLIYFILSMYYLNWVESTIIIIIIKKKIYDPLLKKCERTLKSASKIAKTKWVNHEYKKCINANINYSCIVMEGKTYWTHINHPVVYTEIIFGTGQLKKIYLSSFIWNMGVFKLQFLNFFG